MSYAALIAILAALAFTMPFVVELASHLGVPRGLGIISTLSMAVFGLAWLIVGSRVRRRQRIEACIEAIQEQRRDAPGEPQAFFLEGEHLADLLLKLGHYSEALNCFEAYQAVLEQCGGDAARLEPIITKLRRQVR